MVVKIRAGGQTYEMVQENDAVAHSSTSCWNTPGSGLAWAMAQTRRPVETESSDQMAVHLRN